MASISFGDPLPVVSTIVCSWCDQPMPEGRRGDYCTDACHTTASTFLINHGEGEAQDVAWLVAQLTPEQKRRVVSVLERHDVYIGCQVGHHKASKWGNALHPVGPDRKDPAKVKASVRAYAERLLAHPTRMAQLPELKGKTLACWCRKPHTDTLCHGLVLVALVDSFCSP